MANRPAPEAAKSQPPVDYAPVPDVAETSQEARVDPMEAQFARFMARFSEQLEATTDRLERRIDERIEAVEQQAAQDREAAQARERAGLIAPPPVGNQAVGLYPQPAMDRATRLQVEAAQRKVAFIPKDDPLNPRSLTFDTWINGSMIRIKRGDVGMLPLGHALDLARSGHGHVIDMAAWKSIPVETLPDESLRPSDGPIVSDPASVGTSSIPADMLRRSW